MGQFPPASHAWPSTRARLLADYRSGRLDGWILRLVLLAFALVVLGCFGTRSILASATPPFPKLDDWSRHGNAYFPFLPLVMMFLASRDRWDPTRSVPFNPNGRPLRGGAVHVSLNLVVALVAVQTHPRPQLVIDAFLVAFVAGLAAVGGYPDAFRTYLRRRRQHTRARSAG